MIFLVLLIYLLLLSLLLSSLNPVKLTFVLVILSLNLFLLLYFFNSSIWLSSIYFMIFIGGIMIMFMILSSLLPNEKSLKAKKILLSSMLSISLVFSSFMMMSQNEICMSQQTKFMFLCNESFEILMMVILLYFLSFVYIISKENSSLRSFLC